jgi:hypothetical protein
VRTDQNAMTPPEKNCNVYGLDAVKDRLICWRLKKFRSIQVL